MDTLRTACYGKKNLDCGFYARNSFIDHNLVSVQSLKLGIEFGKKISLGVGYAWLNTRMSENFTLRSDVTGKDTLLSRRLFLRYFCLYAEYVYYKSKHWEFSIPIQAGIGSIGYLYQYGPKTYTANKGLCFIYEPEVDVRYKLFKWLGLGTNVGYRLLFNGDPLVKKTFNSPIISFGVYMIWDELALALFPKRDWVQRKLGPSSW